jgi:hypothetical protein
MAAHILSTLLLAPTTAAAFRFRQQGTAANGSWAAAASLLPCPPRLHTQLRVHHASRPHDAETVADEGCALGGGVAARLTAAAGCEGRLGCPSLDDASAMAVTVMSAAAG